MNRTCVSYDTEYKPLFDFQSRNLDITPLSRTYFGIKALLHDGKSKTTKYAPLRSLHKTTFRICTFILHGKGDRSTIMSPIT